MVAECVKNKTKDTYRIRGEVIAVVNFAPQKNLISVLYIGNIGVYETLGDEVSHILKRSRLAFASGVQNANGPCRGRALRYFRQGTGD